MRKLDRTKTPLVAVRLILFVFALAAVLAVGANKVLEIFCVAWGEP